MTFLFEIHACFFNLYLSKEYNNLIDSIRITPLPKADEFEKERKRVGSKSFLNRVKTAKVVFSIKLDQNNASYAIKEFEEMISNYEFLLSFINRRDVATTGEYVCYLNGIGRQVVGRGYMASKFFFNIPNNNPVIVSGRNIGPITFTKDISSFLDLIFEKYKKIENGYIFNKKDIITSINLYLLNLEPNYEEIKFIQLWTALEALANKLYSKQPLPNGVRFLLTYEEKELFILKIKGLIDELWNNLEHLDERSGKTKLKKRLQSQYIYELDSIDKIKNLLNFLEISEEESVINDTLKDARSFRNNIMHYGSSTDINLEKLSMTRLRLERFLEKVILAIMGVNRNNEGQYLMNFYNR